MPFGYLPLRGRVTGRLAAVLRFAGASFLAFFCATVLRFDLAWVFFFAATFFFAAAFFLAAFFLARFVLGSAGHNMVPRHCGKPQRQAKISSMLSGSSSSR